MKGRRKAQKCCNPQTGEAIKIKASNVVKFKAGYRGRSSIYKLTAVLKDDRRGIGQENSVKADGYDLKNLIERPAGVTGIKSDDIIRYGRRCKTSVNTRDLPCYWETEYFNIRQRKLAGLLNITQSPVSMAAGRGRVLADELKLNFEI